MRGEGPPRGAAAAQDAQGKGAALDFELVRSPQGPNIWRNKRTGETRTTVLPSGGADLEDMRKRLRTSLAELGDKISGQSTGDEPEEAARSAAPRGGHELPQGLAGPPCPRAPGGADRQAPVPGAAPGGAAPRRGAGGRPERPAPAWACLLAAMRPPSAAPPEPPEPREPPAGAPEAGLARLLGAGAGDRCPAWASLRAAVLPGPAGADLAAGACAGAGGAAAGAAAGAGAPPPAPAGRGGAPAPDEEAAAAGAEEEEEAPAAASGLPLQQQIEVQQAAMAAQYQQLMMQQHFHAQMRKLQRQAEADKNASSAKNCSAGGGGGGSTGGGSTSSTTPLPPSERWVCSGCGFYNRISNKWCGGNGHLGCKAMRTDDAEIIKPSLLRPNSVPTIPEEARRYGDWNCPACGDYQFRRNPSCRTCGTLKPTETPLDGLDPPSDPPRLGR